MDILENSDDWILKAKAAENLLEKYGIKNPRIYEIRSNENSEDVILFYFPERTSILKQLFFGVHESKHLTKVVKRSNLISHMKLEIAMKAGKK